jgi:hypothetical protein
MVKFLIFLNFLFLSVINAFSQQRVFKFQANSAIKLVSRERGVELIGKQDDYVRNLRDFDLEGRLHGKKNATVVDYLEFAKQQVSDWSDEDAEKFRRLISSIDSRLAEKGIHLTLPDTIEIVNSTCQEEGGVIGYTRDNFMVMEDEFIYEEVFLHELFHIFTRVNPLKRERLFNILGYKKCSPVDFPPVYFRNIMTNPDSPVYDYFISVNYNNTAIDVIPVILAKSVYNNDGFFSGMDKRLVLLKDASGRKSADIRDSKPVLLKYHNVTGLYEQIGRNTEFNISPEEISAEHFIFLMKNSKNLENQGLIDKMAEILSNN